MAKCIQLINSDREYISNDCSLKFWKFFTIKTWKEYSNENSRHEKDSN